MPGARNWMMVAMKFTAPSNEDVMRKMKPISRYTWPFVVINSDNGGYIVQPACAGPPGIKKLAVIITAPIKKHHRLAMLTRGKHMSTAPIWRGTT